MLAIVRVAVEVGVEAFVRNIIGVSDGLVDGLDDEVETDFDVVIEEQKSLDRSRVGRLIFRQGVHVVEDRFRDLLGVHAVDYRVCVSSIYRKV
jgi:hypothetical protein